jgi:hypothetical protein
MTTAQAYIRNVIDSPAPGINSFPGARGAAGLCSLLTSRSGKGFLTVRTACPALRLGFLLPWAMVMAACASAPRQSPTLTFEQHTLRIPLKVGTDGSVSLAQEPPLSGRIDLAPILEAEGIRVPVTTATRVQVMMFYGRYFVVADGFRSVWELTPAPGTSTASYRRIPLALESGSSGLKGPRLSRYGSSQSSCLRIDRTNGDPVFIGHSGEISRGCP